MQRGVLFERGGVSMNVEERLTRLENAINDQERLNQLERDSIRFPCA